MRHFLLRIAFVLTLVFTACKEQKKTEVTSSEVETENKVESTPTEKVSMDTGVGKNGEAKAVNPAFVDEGGQVVTMENVVRAETAKYLAAETITNGQINFVMSETVLS